MRGVHGSFRNVQVKEGERQGEELEMVMPWTFRRRRKVGDRHCCGNKLMNGVLRLRFK